MAQSGRSRDERLWNALVSRLNQGAYRPSRKLMIRGDTTLVLTWAPTLAKSDGAGVFMPRSASSVELSG